MKNSTRLTAVLLGAGASVDAGLPVTNQLASEVVKALNDQHRAGSRPRWLSALNFTYAAIANYQSRDGSDPLGGVNIERLISALRLLADRESHEAAPFVQTWLGPLLPSGHVQADDHTSRRLVESLGAALDEGQAYRDRRREVGNVGYYVADIAENSKLPVRKGDYFEADRQVLSILSQLLRPSRSVGYLYPLVEFANRQLGGLDVITLNYDLTVEQAASECEVAIARGLTIWPERRIDYSTGDAPLRLHKVHGSLDWEDAGQRRGFDAPRIEAREAGVSSPWLVVGDREKLATAGPTLELLTGARDALERADHLIIAGYGFGDAHINALVRDWLHRYAGRTAGVIDPSWPYPDERTFRGWLFNTFGDSKLAESNWSQSRIQAFHGGAGAILTDALSLAHAMPPAVNEVLVRSVVPGLEGATVTLELKGPPLFDVRFRTDGSSGVEIQDDPTGSLTVQRHEQLPSSISAWTESQAVTVHISQPGARGLQLHMQARTSTSSISRAVSVSASTNAVVPEVGR